MENNDIWKWWYAQESRSVDLTKERRPDVQIITSLIY